MSHRNTERLGNENSTTDCMYRAEQWLPVAIGFGLVAYGLSRLPMRAVVGLGLGACLIARGRVGISMLSFDQGEFSAGECPPQIVSHAIDQRPDESVDEVDESLMESFPASDPPSFSGAASSPSHR